jgi:N-acetylmuramic acid 6-phosphate etherase
MQTEEIVSAINKEDATVAMAVANTSKEIIAVIDAVYHAVSNGGRLFYMGSGTSGRLGIVDASECPPTYGVPHGMVVGIIAGGDSAIRKAVEFAEDDTQQGALDLQEHQITNKDFVLGISASGTTPYVKGALQFCKEQGITCGALSCNANSQIGAIADYSIEVVVGPEVITGSTRMKSGTAQKMVLNMLTTALMIKLGKVQGNKMVDMQLSNDKLVDRGTRMIMEKTGLNYDQANQLLITHGSVRKAVDAYLNP